MTFLLVVIESHILDAFVYGNEMCIIDIIDIFLEFYIL